MCEERITQYPAFFIEILFLGIGIIPCIITFYYDTLFRKKSQKMKKKESKKDVAMIKNTTLLSLGFYGVGYFFSLLSYLACDDYYIIFYLSVFLMNIGSLLIYMVFALRLHYTFNHTVFELSALLKKYIIFVISFILLLHFINLIANIAVSASSDDNHESWQLGIGIAGPVLIFQVLNGILLVYIYSNRLNSCISHVVNDFGYLTRMQLLKLNKSVLNTKLYIETEVQPQFGTLEQKEDNNDNDSGVAVAGDGAAAAGPKMRGIEKVDVNNNEAPNEDGAQETTTATTVTAAATDDKKTENNTTAAESAETGAAPATSAKQEENKTDDEDDKFGGATGAVIPPLNERVEKGMSREQMTKHNGLGLEAVELINVGPKSKVAKQVDNAQLDVKNIRNLRSLTRLMRDMTKYTVLCGFAVFSTFMFAILALLLFGIFNIDANLMLPLLVTDAFFNILCLLLQFEFYSKYYYEACAETHKVWEEQYVTKSNEENQNSKYKLRKLHTGEIIMLKKDDGNAIHSGLGAPNEDGTLNDSGLISDEIQKKQPSLGGGGDANNTASLSIASSIKIEDTKKSSVLQSIKINTGDSIDDVTNTVSFVAQKSAQLTFADMYLTDDENYGDNQNDR